MAPCYIKAASQLTNFERIHQIVYRKVDSKQPLVFFLYAVGNPIVLKGPVYNPLTSITELISRINWTRVFRKRDVRVCVSMCVCTRQVDFPGAATRK